MDTTSRIHPMLAVASQMDARDITALAETYRSWRDVLAAAVDALHARRAMGATSLATERTLRGRGSISTVRP